VAGSRLVRRAARHAAALGPVARRATGRRPGCTGAPVAFACGVSGRARAVGAVAGSGPTRAAEPCAGGVVRRTSARGLVAGPVVTAGRRTVAARPGRRPSRIRAASARVHASAWVRASARLRAEGAAAGRIAFGSRALAFGPFEPSPASRDEIERLADACTRAGMPTTAVEDARGAQWRKVIFNASTNPIGALTGLTHGRVCERPDLRALVSGLVDEGKAVAAAQGIELDADPEALIDHAAKPEVAYGHKASMLQDVEARRQTEVDWLNGGIARFGREHGVPTPLNEAVVALIKGVEAAWTQS
jgi:hypothetical protein